MSEIVIVSSESAVVLLVIDSASPRYEFVRTALLPALRFWGLPLSLMDLADIEPLRPSPSDVSLVVFLQENLDPNRLEAEAAYFNAIVSTGAGVIVADPTLSVLVSKAVFAVTSRTWASVQGLQQASIGDDHFVTALNRRVRSFLFRKPVPVMLERSSGGTPLLKDSLGRAIVVAHDGPVRIVEWNLSLTVWSSDAFGFGRGLDALFWRSILWASRKPFAMAAFPPFGRFRFDDCRGLWRTQADLAFLDIMTAFGEIPNLCICLSSLNDDAWQKLAAFAQRGLVDVSPHVERPDVGIFNANAPTTAERADMAAKIQTLFQGHACPMAKGISDHNHEISVYGLELARTLGLTSRMNVLRVGETWDGLHRAWHPSPFGRLNYVLDRFIDAPDIFTAINHSVSFHDSLTPVGSEHFLCTPFGGFTQDRWDFLNGLVRDDLSIDLDQAIDRLLVHTELALTSLFFLGSISHTHFIRFLSNSDWQRLLSAYHEFADPHGHRPCSYDHIAAYGDRRASLGAVNIEPKKSVPLETDVLWGLLAEDAPGLTISNWTPLSWSALHSSDEVQ
jgi:hypothetical protein